MTDDPSDRPRWWVENESLLEPTGVEAYEPSRFADGRYVHRVVADLEAELGCRVSLVGHNTTYPDDWTVRVDGAPVGTVGRRRTRSGRTVYETTAESFRELVREHVEGE